MNFKVQKMLLLAEDLVLYSIPFIRFLHRYYTRKMLEELPWMKWLPYDAIVKKTGCPDFFVRRILPALVKLKVVERTPVEEIDFSRPAVQARVHAAYGRILHGIWEIYDYRLVIRVPKHRCERPDIDDLDMSTPIDIMARVAS